MTLQKKNSQKSYSEFDIIKFIAGAQLNIIFDKLLVTIFFFVIYYTINVGRISSTILPIPSCGSSDEVFMDFDYSYAGMRTFVQGCDLRVF